MAKVGPIVARSYMGYDVKEASDISGTDCLGEGGPSKTVQSDAIDADINTIVRRFGITGAMPDDMDLSKFVNLEGFPVDYRTAVEYVRTGAEEFMRMPADVRSRFDNDPQKFMDFIHAVDKDGVPVNRPELERLGIVKPVKSPDPVLVKMADLPKDAPK